MNISANVSEYSILDAGEFPDADLRQQVRNTEAALQRALGPTLDKDFYTQSGHCLDIDLPDDSSHGWVLAFQHFQGAWRLVVLEENSRFPAEDA